MTDTEIIKALECCTTKGAKCSECPAFNKVDRSNCKKYFRGAIDLINSQKAEIERLNNELKETGEGMTAQEALKDIIQSGIELGAGDYVNVEALKVAVIALAKQIPKKPIKLKAEQDIKILEGTWKAGTTVYKCPRCDSFISRSSNYCDKCGQALDWSD